MFATMLFARKDEGTTFVGKVNMIKVYRKGPATRKLKVVELARLERELSLRARVQRPAVVEFFVGSGFRNLPMLPPALVKDRATRILDHENDGWIVPPSDYVEDGYDVLDERSMANSITLWIKRYLDNVVPHDSFSVVVE